MNFQELRQRGIAIGVAVLILLLWNDVLGIGAKTGAPPTPPPASEHSAVPDHLETPGHPGHDIAAIAGLVSPPIVVEPSHLVPQNGHAGTASGPMAAGGAGIGSVVSNAPAHPHLPSLLDGFLGQGSSIEATSFAGPGAGDGGQGPSIVMGSGGTGPGGSGPGSGGANCPMTPPQSRDLFNAFVAAGCQWNEDMPWNENLLPPGPPENGEEMTWNENMGGSGDNPSGGPTSPLVSNSRSASVPEPATWLVLGVGMTLIMAAHRARLAPAPCRR